MLSNLVVGRRATALCYLSNSARCFSDDSNERFCLRKRSSWNASLDWDFYLPTPPLFKVETGFKAILPNSSTDFCGSRGSEIYFHAVRT